MSKSTIFFNKPPYIVGSSTIGGPKESQGPIGKFLDLKLKDDRYGEETFEKAECKMLSTVIASAAEKSKRKMAEIDSIVAGDLLNQIISSSFAARDYAVPYIGVYSACSTLSESLAVGSLLISSGSMDNVVCATGSHFASAERQYRYPLELGCTRPPQAQWTVTGAGACVLSKTNIDHENAPKIVSATFGKVTDYGVTDANNMGAAMAPACADTLVTHFKNTGTTPKDYDVIVSGDLGVLGSRIVKDLVWEKGYNMNDEHVDCGEMVYRIDEAEYQGGSGAGCSAIVFLSYFLRRLRERKLKRVLLSATGALLSSVSTLQGESIPCVSHAVEILAG